MSKRIQTVNLIYYFAFKRNIQNKEKQFFSLTILHSCLQVMCILFSNLFGILHTLKLTTLLLDHYFLIRKRGKQVGYLILADDIISSLCDISIHLYYILKGNNLS
jgi:hypothetical protein